LVLDNNEKTNAFPTEFRRVCQCARKLRILIPERIDVGYGYFLDLIPQRDQLIRGKDTEETNYEP
jgi:hypothetical protein